MRYYGIEPVPRLNIYFTHSKKKFRKLLLRAGERVSFHQADGMTFLYTNAKGKNIALVWMRKDLDRGADADAAILAHEAVHVAELYFSMCVREKNPSSEFRAYVTQSVTHFLVNSHYAWKRKRLDSES